MNRRNVLIGIASLALMAGAGTLALAQPRALCWIAPQPRPCAEATSAVEETEITLDKVPAAVRSAAIKLAGDAKNVTRVLREEDDEDVVTYELEFNEGVGDSMTRSAATVSMNGDLLEIERSASMTDLPAAAIAALRNDFPRATFTDPQLVTRMFYEVTVEMDGKRHEVKVDAAGNIEFNGRDEHCKRANDGHRAHGKHENEGEDDPD